MECSTTMDEDQTICAIESQSAHAYHDRRGFERGGELLYRSDVIAERMIKSRG